ncbi:signal peptidase II [Ichthyenterobacterium sp. W332]|uniref:Lipoprotein signal peptidase n=1 Tax=Microcosmobacter mediterraneus TaxID=3075607 RepID=A0ABU2YK62_9FLAO|nr:signal peptidase II [Ichthyenterobacterium sp. W332]MDT0558560.1 signal peptidase II [Ichthyenterobacterium sp. W332]
MFRSVKIVLLIIINIAVDQVSKVLVRRNFDLKEQLAILGDIQGDGAKFLMYYVENKGAFLGMGSDMNDTLRIIFLLILPVLVLGYVTYYIFKTKELDKWSLFAFCCIIGGGIANVFDRIVFGEVTDFFYISLGGVFKTGIFNVADMSVTTGLIILIFSNFFGKKKQTEVTT